MIDNKNLEGYLKIDPIRNGLDWINVNTYKISDIGQIEENLIGIYCWHMFPHITNKPVIKAYSSFFSDPRLNVEVKSKLRYNYSGSVKSHDSIDDELYENLNLELNGFQKYFQSLAFLITSPLYIGKSYDLSCRLNGHATALEKELGTLWSSTKNVLDDDNDDTQFAKRIATYLRENTNRDEHFSISNLFVRTYSFNNKENIEIAKVKKFISHTEKYFLRTLKPIISLR